MSAHTEGAPGARGNRLALVAVLVLAAVLRSLHLFWGLPSLLEEAMPVRIALRMIDPVTGRVDLNPHFFNYPSFAIDLHLIVAHLVYFAGRLLGHYASWADFVLGFDVDPTVLIVASRALHAIADVATVWAVYGIARHVSKSAAWIAVLIATFSSLLIRTSATIIVDTIATALLAWACERLLAWQERGRTRDLDVAAALLGLAASTKYPAALWVVPLLVAIVARRTDAWRLAIRSCAIALVAFAITSPFVILDASSALRDILYERRHMALGHFGSEGRSSLGFHLRNLLDTLGPFGMAALALSPALWLAPGRAGWTRTVLLGLAVLVAPVIAVQYDAERYLAPAIPFAAALAAAGVVLACGRVPVAWRGRATVLAAAAVVLPGAIAGVRAATLGTDSTQRLAGVWCERHVPLDAQVVLEAWSAPLPSRIQKSVRAAEPLYAAASAEARQRFDAVRAYQVTSIPMRVTGTVPAFPNAARADFPVTDINAAYYLPALYASADYVVTSSSVRGRYEAAPERFAVPLRFYRMLEQRAERVAVFTPTHAVAGPTIEIHRLSPALRRDMARAPLPARWWLEWMKDLDRERLDSTLADEPGDGAPAHRWVRDLYASHFDQFAVQLAYVDMWRGDTLSAERLMRPAAGLHLDDGTSVALYAISLGGRGAWGEARTVLESALARGTEDERLLRLQLDKVNARLAAGAR